MSIVQAPIRSGTKVPPPDVDLSSASSAIDNRSQNALHHTLAEKARAR
jgi:hypothetical protein